jgi:putative methionine-R-sulfoxide reductase with GAF domain
MTIKVHAEASTFSEGLTKDEVYTQVLEQAEALLEGQRNWVTILHDLSDLLTNLNQRSGKNVPLIPITRAPLKLSSQ